MKTTLLWAIASVGSVTFVHTGALFLGASLPVAALVSLLPILLLCIARSPTINLALIVAVAAALTTMATGVVTVSLLAATAFGSLVITGNPSMKFKFMFPMGLAQGAGIYGTMAFGLLWPALAGCLALFVWWLILHMKERRAALASA